MVSEWERQKTPTWPDVLYSCDRYVLEFKFYAVFAKLIRSISSVDCSILFAFSRTHGIFSSCATKASGSANSSTWHHARVGQFVERASCEFSKALRLLWFSKRQYSFVDESASISMTF